MKCLMLGCGFAPPKRFVKPEGPDEPVEWTTLDINPDCNPDVVFDLDQLNNPKRKLPLLSNYFHEIHAYQVMEHFGRQGDYKGFFATMREFWRVLVPDGFFIGESPSHTSIWLWGDPGHTRAINRGTFTFLDQRQYTNPGSTTASDYRSLVEPYWWELLVGEETASNFRFILRKVDCERSEQTTVSCLSLPSMHTPAYAAGNLCSMG